MSGITGPKLNRPGLLGTFGKRNVSTSRQASVNLSNSSSATHTTSFSLASKTRNNWVSGQSVSRNHNRYDYQGVRQRLNAGGYQVRNTYAPSSSTVGSNFNMNIDNGNSFMKGQIIGQVINGTFGMLNQLGVFDKIKGGATQTTNSQKIDEAFGTTPTARTLSSSAASVAISNMENATDSASLRGAIAGANDQLSAMNAQTPALESQSEQAIKNKDSLEEDVKTTEKGLSEAKQTLSNKKQTVEAKSKDLETKKYSLEKANSGYAKATTAYNDSVTAYNNAKANTATAQSSVDNLRAQLANATPEQKAAIQTQLTQAEAKLEQAKTAEAKAQKEMESAKQAKDTAYNNLGDAKEAVTQAEQEIDKAQKELDKAKDAEKTAQKNVKDAEDKFELAKQALSAAEGAIDAFKQHKKDVEELTNSITKQNNRLQKLEQKEIDKYNKYDDKAQAGINKNNERSGKIDGDVDTFKERRLSKKMGRTNESIGENLEKRENYSELKTNNEYIQNLLKGPADKKVNGQAYRKGTLPNGEEVYYRDNIPISKEEYENA